MLSERSLLLPCGGGFNSIEKQLRDRGENLIVFPSNTATATAFLYLDKVKNVKLSPHVIKAKTVLSMSSQAQIDSLKSTNMESSASNNNNNNDHNDCNFMVNHVRKNFSGSDPQATLKQPQIIVLSGNGNVKKERLSPCTNGDLQPAISRSRSTTPLSFQGASPSQISTETLMPLTSLLRIQQAASTDHQNVSYNSAHMESASLDNATAVLQTEYSARNYSDIMRSLAAKYNDSNNINQASTRRNPFFETPIQGSPSTNKNTNQQTVTRSTALTTSSTAISKQDAESHMIPQLSMPPSEVAVAAAAASFLSSLPFSQNVCPPLIDMSSTQALVTLARAAKEAEIHTILRSSQPNPKTINPSPISPHPNLSAALQQAAQFVSPALIYSAQLQQQLQQKQTSNQSSPMHMQKTASPDTSGIVNKSKSTLTSNAITVPLDLSSQPLAAKRFKVESVDNDHIKGPRDFEIPVKKVKIANVSLIKPSETKDLVGSIITNQKIDSSCSNTPANLEHIKLNNSQRPPTINPSSNALQCQAQSEEIAQWSVDDVCAFVGAIDICTDYVQNFRDQCIDGTGLPLLTEDHLLNSLGMKLGPALKLRSRLAKKLGGPCPCASCFSQTRQILAFQASVKNGVVIPAAGVSTEAENTKTCEKISNSIKKTDLIDKAEQTIEERRESEHSQQFRDLHQPSLCNNNDSSNSRAALTLQICANIYKNETNNNIHNNESLSSENKRSITKITNEPCNNSINCVLDPAVSSLINEDCKSFNDTGNSNSGKNGSLQRIGSGDIADVGS